MWTLLNPMVGLRLAWKYLRRPRVDPLELPAQNKSVMGFNLIWMFSKVSQLISLLDELYEMDLEPPLVGQTFAFEDLPQALRLFQSGQTTGRSSSGSAATTTASDVREGEVGVAQTLGSRTGVRCLSSLQR